MTILYLLPMLLEQSWAATKFPIKDLKWNDLLALREGHRHTKAVWMTEIYFYGIHKSPPIWDVQLKKKIVLPEFLVFFNTLLDAFASWKTTICNIFHGATPSPPTRRRSLACGTAKLKRSKNISVTERIIKRNTLLCVQFLWTSYRLCTAAQLIEDNQWVNYILFHK